MEVQHGPSTEIDVTKENENGEKELLKPDFDSYEPNFKSVYVKHNERILKEPSFSDEYSYEQQFDHKKIQKDLGPFDEKNCKLKTIIQENFFVEPESCTKESSNRPNNAAGNGGTEETSKNHTLQEIETVAVQGKVKKNLLKCSQCTRTISGAQQLRIHVKMWHIEGKYKCDLCSKVFQRKGKLKNHKHDHKERDLNITHICDICTTTFKSLSSLTKHIKQIHEHSKDITSCGKCGKQFRYLALLN